MYIQTNKTIRKISYKMKSLHAYLKKHIYEIEFLKCNTKKFIFTIQFLYTRDIYFQIRNFETKYRKFVNIKKFAICISIWNPPTNIWPPYNSWSHHPHFADIQSIFCIAPRPFPSPSSTQIPTQKNKTLVAPPLVKPTIRHALPPSPPESCQPATDAPQITPILRPHQHARHSSEQQKNPAHSHGILILHIETSSMVPPNVVGYCVLHPSGWPKPGALKSRPTHHVSPTFHATPTAP